MHRFWLALRERPRVTSQQISRIRVAYIRSAGPRSEQRVDDHCRGHTSLQTLCCFGEARPDRSAVRVRRRTCRLASVRAIRAEGIAKALLRPRRPSRPPSISRAPTHGCRKDDPPSAVPWVMDRGDPPVRLAFVRTRKDLAAECATPRQSPASARRSPCKQLPSRWALHHADASLEDVVWPERCAEECAAGNRLSKGHSVPSLRTAPHGRDSRCFLVPLCRRRNLGAG
jgi:hypothetical protein